MSEAPGDPVATDKTDDRVRVYRARWIVENSRVAHEDAELVVHGARVKGIRKRQTSPASADFGDAIILPGLVNAHTHLDLTLCVEARDYVEHAESPDFWHWVRLVVAFRRQASPALLQAAVQEGVRQSIAAGVTAVGDITTIGLPLDLWHPLRGVVFGEALGVDPERERDVLEQAADWLARAPADASVRPSLAPHAPYSTSFDLYRACAEFVRPLGLPLATHLAETAEEMELCSPQPLEPAAVRGNGRHQAGKGGGLVRLLQELNAWVPERIASLHEVLRLVADGGLSWVIAHGNRLSRAQWLALRNWATVVFCPSTHERFRRGYHPYEAMSTDGVDVAIGTDSLASARSLSVLDEARSLYRGGTAWPPGVLLAAITRIPARALGLHHHGALETGCFADFCVVPLCSAASDPLKDLFSSDAPVVATYIGGEQVFERS